MILLKQFFLKLIYGVFYYTSIISIQTLKIFSYFQLIGCILFNARMLYIMN